jgi:predicted amidophosphoribosyltransferase
MPRQPTNEKVTRLPKAEAGNLPPLPPCPGCGRQIRNGGQLCSRCWKRSPEGKAADAERKRLKRQSIQLTREGVYD